MALKTKVKISQITNLSDARYCAGMGVHYLGFNFSVNHENYVSPETFQEIKTWISGPEFVGEFEDSEPSYIREIISKVALDWIEVCQPEKLNELSLIGKPIILRCKVDRCGSLSQLEDEMNFAKDMVDFFLLERTAGDIYSMEKIFKLSQTYPILLGFGIKKENVHKIVLETEIKGIALKGGREEQVGFKDYEGLADILEELEIE